MPVRKSDIVESVAIRGRWRGLNLQSDAGAIDPLQFRALENVESHEGKLTDRGGQQKVNSTPETGTSGIEWIYDASDIGAP